MLSEEMIDLPSEWFAPDALPLEVDFGCHRGVFLTGMAELHGRANFLGIEKQAARVGRCRSKIVRRGIVNAWAVRGEGVEAVRQFLPDGSVAIFHVLFPDPWPKRRHAGRRLVNEEFLAEVRRVLRPNGMLRLMTDDEGYFQEMRQNVAEGWMPLEWDAGRPVVPTSFEATFRALGRSPHCLALRRADLSTTAAAIDGAKEFRGR